MSPILNLDYKIFDAINSLAGQWKILDLFGIFCAKYLIFVIAGIVAGWWLGLHKTKTSPAWPLEGKRKWLAFGHLSLSVLLSILLNYILGFIKFRTRPFFAHSDTTRLVNPLSEKSFPSDHTAVALAAALAVFFYHKKLGILLMFLALLVGVARIYTGVHYPLDVLGGIVVGIVSALGVWFLVRQRK